MTELIAPGATLEKLWTGGEWCEGPVWMPATRSVRFSDIPNDRILEFDSATGLTRVHRESVEFTNGRTLDLDGLVVQCSQGRRRVEREVDGEPVAIVERWNGGRFNSPNDVIVASDGSVWFTDPPYGLHESGRGGHPGEQDYDGCFVFRHDESTGVTQPVITDMVHPNGLAFSPDEELLYVTDTACAWDTSLMPVIRAYDISRGTGRVFAEPEDTADGLRVDAAGRVWTSNGARVTVYAPGGERLLDIPVPELVANVCFGGPDGRDLYVTASTSLYRIATTVTEAPRF